MSLKLWDVNMEGRPLATYPVHEPLRGKLCELYESDCIFDKFDCCMSRSGDMVATGAAPAGRPQPRRRGPGAGGGLFFDVGFGFWEVGCGEGWRGREGARARHARPADPHPPPPPPPRARAHTTGTYNNSFKVFGVPGGGETSLEATRDPLRKRAATPNKGARFGIRKTPLNGKPAPVADADGTGLDLSMKLLHLAWHPEANVLACAASNSLYMICNS